MPPKRATRKREPSPKPKPSKIKPKDVFEKMMVGRRNADATYTAYALPIKSFWDKPTGEKPVRKAPEEIGRRVRLAYYLYGWADCRAKGADKLPGQTWTAREAEKQFLRECQLCDQDYLFDGDLTQEICRELYEKIRKDMQRMSAHKWRFPRLPEIPDFAPTDKDSNILVYLAEQKTTQIQVEIVAGSGEPKSIVAVRLPVLEREGYVHRPNGERKGWTLTNKGKAFVSK